MLTKPFKPLALAFLVNLIISVEDKIKYIYISSLLSSCRRCRQDLRTACKCKNQIDNSSVNLTTIQIHGSCRNSTVHFLQGTVNLSSVRKLNIWGCLCFPVTCIFVIKKKLAAQVVLKYCRLETLMQ